MIKKYFKEERIDELGLNLVVAKAIGNYNKFVDEVFDDKNKENLLFNLATGNVRTYRDRYIDLLSKGKCILFGSNLVFKKGTEKEYLNYLSQYLENMNNEDKQLFDSLKDKHSFGMIKATLSMYKMGIHTKDIIQNTYSKYFIDSQYLESILKEAV